MNNQPTIEAQLTAARERIQELEYELQYFKKVVDDVPAMIYEFKIDAQGTVSFPFVSKGSIDVYGETPEAIKADPSVLIEAIIEDDRQSFQDTVAQSAQTLEMWNWEGRSIHDGKLAWIRGQSMPRPQPDGSIIWRGIVIDIAEYKALERDLHRYSAILEKAPDIIGISNMQGIQMYLNPAGRKLIGYQPDEDITHIPLKEVHPEWASKYIVETGIPIAIEQGSWYAETAILDLDQNEIPVSQLLLHYPGDKNIQPFFATIMRDIREQKADQAERERLQNEIIYTQQTTLAELSTPLIQLKNDIVLLPLVGAIDSQRALQIMETLLDGTAQYGARIAILDVSGVPVVDTQVGATLIQAAQALRLLGSQVILTGIRPEMAQTLVTLNIDLRTIVTFSNLAQGLDYALR